MVLNTGQISAQYLRKGEINVTILEVKSPAHFIVKESPGINTSPEAKKFAEIEELIQKYYSSVEESFSQLPLKNSIVIILHRSKFYRAKVHSILNLSDGNIIRVYLLDYGGLCNVPKNQVFKMQKDFLGCPFQAVEFKLVNLEPLSLVMMINENLTIEQGSVFNWDTAAKVYFEDLKKAMYKSHITVKGFQNYCLFGALYFTLKDETVICVNAELVSKKYANENVELSQNVIDMDVFLQSSEFSENAYDGHSNEKILKIIPPKPFNCSSSSESEDSKFKYQKTPPPDVNLNVQACSLTPPEKNYYSDTDHLSSDNVLCEESRKIQANILRNYSQSLKKQREKARMSETSPSQSTLNGNSSSQIMSSEISSSALSPALKDAVFTKAKELNPEQSSNNIDSSPMSAITDTSNLPSKEVKIGIYAKGLKDYSQKMRSLREKSKSCLSPPKNDKSSLINTSNLIHSTGRSECDKIKYVEQSNTEDDLTSATVTVEESKIDSSPLVKTMSPSEQQKRKMDKVSQLYKRMHISKNKQLASKITATVVESTKSVTVDSENVESNAKWLETMSEPEVPSIIEETLAEPLTIDDDVMHLALQPKSIFESADSHSSSDRC